MITQNEMKDEFERFLNERGLYFDFLDFIKSSGYTPHEFGMSED